MTKENKKEKANTKSYVILYLVHTIIDKYFPLIIHPLDNENSNFLFFCLNLFSFNNFYYYLKQACQTGGPRAVWVPIACSSDPLQPFK